MAADNRWTSISEPRWRYLRYPAGIQIRSYVIGDQSV